MKDVPHSSLINEVHPSVNLRAPRGVSRNVLKGRELIKHFNARVPLRHRACVFHRPFGRHFFRACSPQPEVGDEFA